MPWDNCSAVPSEQLTRVVWGYSTQLDRIERVLENGLCAYWGLTAMPSIYPNDISVRMQLWIACVTCLK